MATEVFHALAVGHCRGESLLQPRYVCHRLPLLRMRMSGEYNLDMHVDDVHVDVVVFVQP